MPIIIDATSDDAEVVTHIQVAAWQAAYPGLMPAEDLAAFTETRQRRMWDRILAQPKPNTATILIETDNHQIAGFVCTGPSRSPELGYDGEIVAVNFLPAFWGKALAEPLLRAGVRRLIQTGFSDMHLWVVAENLRARRFYERVLGPGVIPDSAIIKDGVNEIAYGWRDINSISG